MNHLQQQQPIANRPLVHIAMLDLDLDLDLDSAMERAHHPMVMRRSPTVGLRVPAEAP